MDERIGLATIYAALASIAGESAAAFVPAEPFQRWLAIWSRTPPEERDALARDFHEFLDVNHEIGESNAVLVFLAAREKQDA